MILYTDSEDDADDYETIELPKQTSLLKFEYSACAQYILFGFIIESICQFILVTYLIMNFAVLPKLRIYFTFFICHQFCLLVYQIVLLQNHRFIRKQLLQDIEQNIPSRLNKQQNPFKGRYWDTCHQTLIFMELISFSMGQAICKQSVYRIPYYIFLIQHGGTFLIFISIFVFLTVFAIKTIDCQNDDEFMIEEDFDLQPNINVNTSIKHSRVTAAQVQPDNACAICLQQYQENEQLAELNCDIEKLHFFHDDCFSYWASRHNTCPLCRKIFT